MAPRPDHDSGRDVAAVRYADGQVRIVVEQPSDVDRTMTMAIRALQAGLVAANASLRRISAQLEEDGTVVAMLEVDPARQPMRSVHGSLGPEAVAAVAEAAMDAAGYEPVGGADYEPPYGQPAGG